MITLFVVHPKGFNVGNDAIQVGLRELVHEAFGRVVNLISIPAVSTYESHSKAGLTAKTIHEINRFGDGVLIGGGNLYENGELAVSQDALSALEAPLMLFSLSRGKIYNRNLDLADRTDVMPDRTIRALHERATCALSRDLATENHLQSIGCANSKLGGCPTLYLNRYADRLPKLPASEDAGVLISIRNPALMNIPVRLQSRVQGDVEGIIDFLREQNVGRIRLLCHDIRDVEFATVFQSTRQVDFVYTTDVYWYLALLKAAKLNISYRLHATLPCISYGTPSIKISYDERALSLFETLGLGDWNIDLVRSSDLLAEVKNRYHRLDELKSLAAALESRWESIRGVQIGAMTRFADEVRAYVKRANYRATTVLV